MDGNTRNKELLEKIAKFCWNYEKWKKDHMTSDDHLDDHAIDHEPIKNLENLVLEATSRA